MSTTSITPNPSLAADRAAATARRDDLVLGGATVGMGLLAGLFYGYSCSVMPGLHDASDQTVVDAMQNINRAIQNPVFFTTFLGAPALAAWAWRNECKRGSARARRWIGAGVLLGGLCLLITGVFNIPLNDQLDQAGTPQHLAHAGQLAQVRDDFETPWVIWNVVRTVATVGAFGCLAYGARLRLLHRDR
ncbi:MAG TPA: anthrone oxygenase family protein [Baekduia sp.]|nr:anthrone oxygenase family protein [Baekduia sp.]